MTWWMDSTLPTFFLKTANRLPSSATGPLGSDVRCATCWTPTVAWCSLTANDGRLSSSSSVSDAPSESWELLCPSTLAIGPLAAPASKGEVSRKNSSAPSTSSLASNQMLPLSLNEVAVDIQVLRTIGLVKRAAGEQLGSERSSTVAGSGDA